MLEQHSEERRVDHRKHGPSTSKAFLNLCGRPSGSPVACHGCEWALLTLLGLRKPSPDIYNLCKGSLSLHSEDVVIIEDDLVGLQAAKAAHCACLITKSTYSVNDDFKTADLVVDDLKVTDMSYKKLTLCN